MNLAGQFLVAMPAMVDPHFQGAVVYVCEHGDKGALGLVINRPTELTLARLFDQVALKLEIAVLREMPVYFGGPVQKERGFVLHQPCGAAYSSSLEINAELALTTSKDVLEDVSRGQGPQRMLVTLGYAGWGQGQLEREVADNAWLTVPADVSIIFDLPAKDRFSAALGLLGIDPLQLSGQVGHA